MQTTPDFPKQAPRGARVRGVAAARGVGRPTSEARPKPPRAERERPSAGEQGEPTRYGAGF